MLQSPYFWKDGGNATPITTEQIAICFGILVLIVVELGLITPLVGLTCLFSTQWTEKLRLRKHIVR